MGTPLTGLTPAQTYPSLFKVGDNTSLSSTLKRMSDGLGNDAPLFMSLNHLTNRGVGNEVTNTAFGELSMVGSSTGHLNTSFGYQSLRNLTTGNGNTAVGSFALSSLTTGSANVAVGSNALVVTTVGVGNAAIGHNSMNALTSGFSNTALGATSLSHITTGNRNTVIGNSTGLSITTETWNTILGAASNVQAGVNQAVVIGTFSTATESSQLFLGSNQVGHTLGVITQETITPNTTWTLYINGIKYKIPLLAI